MAIGLLTTPLILHNLGPTEFGTYAVLGSLAAYFGVLDLGIGGSLTRFMTFHSERGERDRVGTLATFATLFYLALGVVLLPSLIAAAPAIGRLLGLPTNLQAQFPLLLAMVGGLFVGWALTGVVSARLTAEHRLDLTAVANVIGAVGMAVLIFTLVPRFPQIRTVFVCMAGQLGLVWLVSWAMSRRLTGALLSSPHYVRWAEIRELFAFGLWSQLSSLTALVNLEADKVIISRNLGIADVTPYQVANRIALLSRALPLQMLGSLLPAVTARFSLGMERNDMLQLYRRSSRSLMLSTLLISGFVAVAADPILRVWLGVRLPGAAPICTALVLSYSVNNLTGAGTIILRAQGKPQLETLYGLLSAGLNIVLTIALIRALGLTGVVVGTICGNVIGSVVFVVLFHQRQHFPWWRTMGCWLVPLCLVTGASAFVTWTMLKMVAAPEASRLTLLTGLSIAGLGYCASFVLFGWIFRLWTLDDRAFLNRMLIALRIRRARTT